MIVALDIGTSSVRAIAYDLAGRPVPGVVAAEEHQPRTTPDGGAELIADELVERCVRCLEQVVARLGHGPGGVSAGGGPGQPRPVIAGVATCAVWHSLVGVDGSGLAITPIYLWADTRPVSALPELHSRVPEAWVHQRTGCMFHTMYYPAKLLWLERTVPETFRRVAHWMSPGEYVYWRLFGQLSCSYSMASGTGLFHLHALDWDEQLMAHLPISRAQLSPLVDANRPLQGLLPPYRARLGALADVPWFPALGDGACSNMGAGCVSPQRLAVMVGTSGAMRVVAPRHAGTFAPPAGLWTYVIDSQRMVVGGALSNGGNLLTWLRQNLLLPDPDNIPEDLYARPGAHGLTVLPFLAGERSPGYAAHAVGVVHGLRLSTSATDILQAALEAVVYRFCLIYDRLRATMPEPEAVIATGGGLLHVPAWMQILADALGRPVVASAVEEGSSRGAALRAAESLGLVRLNAVEAPTGRTFAPDPGRHEAHRRALERQGRLYDTLIREHPLV